MGSGNTEIIDSLVSEEALRQLETLNTRVDESYVKFERILLLVQKFSVELEKGGKSFQETTKTIEGATDAISRSNEITEETNKAEAARNKLIEQTVKAEKERKQVMLDNLAVSERVDKLMKQTLGTQEQNAKLMIRYNNELKNLASEEKKLSEAVKNGAISAGQANKQRESMLLREIELKQAKSDLQIVMKNEQKILNETDGTYKSVDLQLSKMRMTYRQLTDDVKRSPLGQELYSDIVKFDTAVKASSYSVGNFQQNVGNYASGMRDVSRVIGMVNPQLGALVNRVQSVTVYKELWAKANKTVSESLNITTKATRALMFTGVGALIAILTTLIMWYKKWKEQQEELIRLNNLHAESMKNLSLETQKSAAKDTNQLRILYEATQDVSRSMGERLAAAQELQKMYPDYLGNLSQEEILAGRGADAYERLTEQILASAYAKAAADKVAENRMKMLEMESKLNDTKNKITEKEIELSKKQTAFQAGPMTGGAFKEGEKYALQAIIESLGWEAGKTQEEIDALKKSTEELIKTINVDDLLFQIRTGEKSESKSAKPQKDESDAEIKAYQQVVMFKIKLEADAQKQIASDTKKSYAERRDAMIAYRDSQIALIEKQREFELSNDKLTQSGRELINLTADEKIRQSREELSNSLQDIEKKNYEKLYEQAQEYFNKLSELNATQEQGELVDLSAQYAKGLIKKEEYEKQKVEIAKKYAIQNFEASINFLEEELLKYEENSDLTEKISAQLAKAKADYAKWAAKAEISANEESVKAQKNAYDALKEYLSSKTQTSFQDVWKSMIDISNMYYDEQLKRIDELEKREKEYYSDKLKTINNNVEAGLMSEEEADARKRIIEETQLQREKEYEQQRKEMQKKQAVWQKANAIIQAMINTAVAFTSALGLFPPPLGIAMAAIVGAMGAAQVAMIASKSIPSYAHGTDDHPGGLARVGESGRAEMVILPTGEKWKTPARETITWLPRHTEVLPDFKTALSGMLAKHSGVIYDDSFGEIVTPDEVLRRNTKEASIRLSSIDKGINAWRANAMYSEKKAYLLYRMNKYTRNGN